jgi:hypothetical protein
LNLENCSSEEMEKDDLISVYEENTAKKKKHCHTRPTVIATIAILTLGNVVLSGILFFQPHSDMNAGSDSAIGSPRLNNS